MTVQECYEKMGANYQSALGRLGNDQIMQRFAVKFLDDKSYQALEKALAQEDVEQAFRAAHTLKGVCLNLGFDNLYVVSSALTERLREKRLDGTKEMFEDVTKQYQITVDAIRQL